MLLRGGQVAAATEQEWEVVELQPATAGQPAVLPDTETATDPRPPVQLVVNTRRKWEQWASGAVPAPPYEEVLANAAADVQMLAQYATGMVAHAYEAGRAISVAQEASRQYFLRGLDKLHDVHQQVCAELDAADIPTAVDRVEYDGRHASAYYDVAEEALRYRQLGLDEPVPAAATAAVKLQDIAEVHRLAQQYEQGPVGPPPAVSDVQL